MQCVHVVTFPSSYRGVTVSCKPLTFVLSNQPIICSQLTTVNPGAFFIGLLIQVQPTPVNRLRAQAPDL